MPAKLPLYLLSMLVTVQISIPRKRWVVSQLDLLCAQEVGYVLRSNAAFLPLTFPSNAPPAAAQALKAQSPDQRLYVAFDPQAAPLLDETAWGAVDGGALVPADLNLDPAAWRGQLTRAQDSFPGRPWTLWLPSDPGALVSILLGDGGRGSAEQCGVMAEVDIHMGTLGKALGSFGAYAAASREIIAYLVNRARSFIFSTSLPPAVLAASLAAFDLVDSPSGLALRLALAANTGRFKAGLLAAGFDTMGSETQIVQRFWLIGLIAAMLGIGLAMV